MATGITGRSFLAVVKRSGVVSAEELQRSLKTLQQRNVPLDDPDALAAALMDVGVLTRWQAEKMLQGKHKGFFLGPYRLLDMLGKGGMGAVYLAEHTLMRRRCAIKVLPTKNIGSRSYLERFYREAQAVAAMDHKNIVRAYDVNQAQVGDAGVHFLAMEYVEGRDLQRIVDEDGALRYTEAAEYIRQAAEGLAHAHEAGMVHRDVKPANLLVNLKGVVKILDLGLAKFYDDAQEASLTVAHQETVLGTADYLAPEQAVDSHKTDHRADIYSLGCTFYFVLTGHPPFCEGSVANRLLHHQIKPPPPIRDDRPDAPESLLAIIDRMMAKDREHRYQAAHDVAEDLTVWLAENGDEAWREQNAELVRKVGESWRSDTKIGADMVDTAELDLRADDDLDLAPLENGEEPSSLKESPLVADEPPKRPAAAAESKADSSISLKPDTKPAKSPAPSPEQPAPLDLPPLEETAALTPLDNLQSLDVLSSEFAAEPSAPAAGSDASVLSSGIGLGASPAASSGAARTKPAESSIPMSWIIAIATVGVVVVLGVLLLIIFGSSGASRPASESSAAAAPPHPIADDVQSAAGASLAAVADASSRGDAAPTSDAASASEAPPAQDDEAASPTPPADADAANRKPKPKSKPKPKQKRSGQKQAPSQEAATPVTTEAPSTAVEPSPAVELAAAPQPPSPPQAATATSDQTPPDAEELKKLWSFEYVSLEVDLPEPLSMFSQGYKKRIEDILEDFKLSANADARLQITYRVDTPKNVRGDAKIPYSVEAVLSVKDQSGRMVELWRDSKENPAGDPYAKAVNELREQAATLVRRLLIERKRALGVF